MLEQSVVDVDFSDLPCLASRRNSNLTSDDMSDHWLQGITVDDYNCPASENIPYEVPQLMNGYYCKSEGIIFPRQ